MVLRREHGRDEAVSGTKAMPQRGSNISTCHRVALDIRSCLRSHRLLHPGDRIGRRSTKPRDLLCAGQKLNWICDRSSQSVSPGAMSSAVELTGAPFKFVKSSVHLACWSLMYQTSPPATSSKLCCMTPNVPESPWTRDHRAKICRVSGITKYPI